MERELLRSVLVHAAGDHKQRLVDRVAVLAFQRRLLAEVSLLGLRGHDSEIKQVVALELAAVAASVAFLQVVMV